MRSDIGEIRCESTLIVHTDVDRTLELVVANFHILQIACQSQSTVRSTFKHVVSNRYIFGGIVGAFNVEGFGNGAVLNDDGSCF